MTVKPIFRTVDTLFYFLLCDIIFMIFFFSKNSHYCNVKLWHITLLNCLAVLETVLGKLVSKIH